MVADRLLVAGVLRVRRGGWVMIVGCYDLVLYCDGRGLAKCKERGEYPAYDRSTAYSEARKDGWRIGRSGKCRCPRCNLPPHVYAARSTGDER